jgi:hypothetical protein
LYIGNNSYDLAIERRAAGKIDAGAFGRPFIANPDLVERLRRGVPLTHAPRESYYGGTHRQLCCRSAGVAYQTLAFRRHRRGSPEAFSFLLMPSVRRSSPACMSR